uniref:L-rhamnose-binding lectin CSL2-like n=1 Tax=Paramormyrops kingsleyae TaxID=1676925 RepID=A0A3B3RWQ8_9TELE|nr:L-rhamnose-binding lectin CSL2-like [Paramormyrops kingsleyae]
MLQHKCLPAYCKADEGVISVQKANYGCTDSHVCASNPQKVASVTCTEATTTSVLSQSCNGRSMCEVTVSPALFSDPCQGTSKYLNSSYVCLPAKTSITCQHSSDILDCGTDVIKVLHTNYGRRDTTTCSVGRPPKEVMDDNCFLSVTAAISDRCNGKSKCSVTPDDFSTDPCYGSFKYLEVSYGCLASRKSITCGGPYGSISCENDLIRIYDAFYGQMSPTICSNGRPESQLTNTNCALANVVDIVSKGCNDRTSCDLAFAFTDPCFGTYKYLEVSYGCIETCQSSLDCSTALTNASVDGRQGIGCHHSTTGVTSTFSSSSRNSFLSFFCLAFQLGFSSLHTVVMQL